MPNARALLTELYREAVAAVSPDAAVRDALRQRARAVNGARTHLFAIGKASEHMLHGAELWLSDTQQQCAGGVCIAHHDVVGTSLPVQHSVGDHPVPGTRSKAAADGLGRYITTSVQHGDQAIVLLSGGASALIGAPAGGLTAAAYTKVVHALLGSGLSIDAVNAVRRRLSRWGGGRFGAALQARGASIEVLVVSDVLGDSLASIGSGPCVRDMLTLADTLAFVRDAHLASDVRDEIVRALHAVELTREPTPQSAEFAIPHTIVSSNAAVLRAIADGARARGVSCTVMSNPLTDDATLCGERVADALLQAKRLQRDTVPHLLCWGGEPVVVLPTEHQVPSGGRMQALALSAARVLGAAGTEADGVTILAAGTDGRDGATDAAGAVVDGDTWRAIERAGRVPAKDLVRCESYDALRAANAHIPEFVSGTNVNDVVIGVVLGGD
jgi:glycerate 2-kinase